MKRNTEELKEKLISVGIEEIRTNGIGPDVYAYNSSKMWGDSWSSL